MCLENYLYEVKNNNHRKALSRFRLSNHSLLIEKGRHQKPPLDREDRKCFVCRDFVENEKHFLITCPLYEKEREELLRICRQNCSLFDTLISEEEKFVYLMSSENTDVMKSIAMSDSFKIREQNVRK